ncbi:L-fucose/L-arabinose isomerase family protein [Virgibacillus sp. JSM 102003]|uniref:sulfoquinovose isomerase n=1 Tax=Virgibacillus sp. JSM 102003 TaxID=1562108 RepID=UPI0035BF0660
MIAIGKILYLPIGRKTFDMETGEKERQKSSALLHDLTDELIEPERIITAPSALQKFLLDINTDEVAVTIYQSVTFADGQFIRLLLEHVSAPVIVWSIREPSVGERLRLNSLTGGNSTCHVLKSNHHPYTFVFGNSEEAQVQRNIKQQLNIRKLIDRIKNFNIGVLGDHQPGFYFSGTDEKQLKDQFGIDVIRMDLQEAFDKSKQMPEEKWEKEISRAKEQVIGLNATDETVKRFAKFSAFVREEIHRRNISALSIRCWPEFFNELGAAACSTLSQFTEDGVVSSCESDIHGALTMFILQELSGGEAPYLGDMVHINEASNSVVLWHCGAGAYSLAHPEKGAQPGVHPNRGLGFTMEFGLKPGIVTIFRVGYTTEGYRLLVMRGNALDTPQRFNGTSVEVELETNVMETLYGLMEEGFEPHYGLVYADVVSDLMELGKQLQLPVSVYTVD